MKQKIKNFKFTKGVVLAILLAMLFLGMTAGGIVYGANALNNTQWTGKDDLKNGEILVGYLVDDITALVNDIAILDADIATLQSDATANANEIAGLEQDKLDLQAEINDLQNELLKANQDAAAFQTAVCAKIITLPNGIYNNGSYSDICPRPTT